MKIKNVKISGLKIIQTKIFFDKRGFFKEVYKNKIFDQNFKFDCMSRSKKNVLRGLHFQRKNPQGKFLSVLKGEIFDVALDCRPNSKTFGKHFKIILNDKNCKSIFIPPGFAHGFLGLKKENIVMYGCTKYRNKKSESGIFWNDPELKIKWPVKKPILSAKDKNNKPFGFFF